MTFVERLMSNAIPILIWSAIILIFAGLLEHYVLAVPLSSSSETNLVRLFSSAVSYSLGNAVWPFVGAALIWTLQSRANGAEG